MFAPGVKLAEHVGDVFVLHELGVYVGLVEDGVALVGKNVRVHIRVVVIVIIIFLFNEI